MRKGRPGPPQIHRSVFHHVPFRDTNQVTGLHRGGFRCRRFFGIVVCVLAVGRHRRHGERIVVKRSSFGWRRVSLWKTFLPKCVGVPLPPPCKIVCAGVKESNALLVNECNARLSIGTMRPRVNRTTLSLLRVWSRVARSRRLSARGRVCHGGRPRRAGDLDYNSLCTRFERPAKTYTCITNLVH